MTTKDLAKRLIDALPDDATFADIGYALHVRSRIERGDAQAERGETLRHDAVKQRIDQWRK